jgi:radical SAM superfamily enzyme
MVWPILQHISLLVDRYNRTNWSASNMGMISIDGAVDCDVKDASVAHGDCQFWVPPMIMGEHLF